MRLKSVEIVNFRLFEHLTLDLHPRMNVLVGGNAAGKTSALEAIAFTLDQLMFTGRDEPEGHIGAADLRRERDGRVAALSVDLVAEDGARYGVRYDGRAASPSGGRLPQAAPVPLAVYFGTDRVVSRLSTPEVSPEDLTSSAEAATDAWVLAFSPHLNFAQFRQWFVRQSITEALQQSRLKRFDIELPSLKTVRDAIRSMIPGCRDLRLAGNPPRILASMGREDGRVEEVDFTELSDGYRTLLAVVADIARRMAIANPQQGLHTSALILIDEVDLHLHPRWQQVVLGGLLSTFPNAQFLVTTHSPQIIATAEPEHLLALVREQDQISVARPSSTYGALPDRILEDVMGVPDARPPDVASRLSRYLELIALDRSDTDEGRELRAWLDGKFRGHDPVLVRADLEIRRRKLAGGRAT